jgi:TatD DNase family protein
MIDTHIHLESKEYDADRQEVIKRFFDEGGKAIVNIGVDEQRIEKTLEIARSNERIFAAVGFHPQEAAGLQIRNPKYEIRNKSKIENSNVQDTVDFLRDTVIKNKDKIVAIGEIGLDYFHASSKDYRLKINDKIKKAQKDVFVSQLDLARELKLPVIIHTWDAQDDCWEILKNYTDLKMVFHCYGKGIPLDFTKKLLGHDNIFFSFTGNVTFPRLGKTGSEIFEHLRLIPLEKMMAETDGPYLSPEPHRGKRNEPAYVKFVIEKIAEIKGLSVEEVENQTDQNAVEFFGLKI